MLQKRTPQPLADVELLARPPVLMTNLATLLVGFGMFGSFILIPQLAEAPESTGYGFGLSATGAGPADAPRRARDARRRPVRRACSCAATAASCRSRWAR